MTNDKLVKIILSSVIIIIMAAVLFVFPQLSSESQLIFFGSICVLFTGLLLAMVKGSLPFFNHKSNGFSKNLKSDILLVDDNPANLQMLKETLSRLFLASAEAENGKSALALHQKNPFKIILMDLEMPEMNGTETTQHIRNKESDTRVPIIAVSAHTDNDIRLTALATGFDDYLTKPVDEDSLKTILHRWLHTNSTLSLTPPPETITTNNAYHPDAITEDSIDNTLDSDADTDINTDVSPDTILNNSTEEDDLAQVMSRKFIPKKPDGNNKAKKIVDIQQSLIYSHNNPQLAKDMMIMLIIMISKEKDRMISFYKKKDWEGLGHLVHKINGGSCYCGVPELQNKAQLIDEAIQNNSIKVIEHSFDSLLEAMDDLLNWHKQHDLDVIFEN